MVLAWWGCFFLGTAKSTGPSTPLADCTKPRAVPPRCLFLLFLSPGATQGTGCSSSLQQSQRGPGLHLAPCSHFQLLPTALLLGTAALPTLLFQRDGASLPAPHHQEWWGRPGVMVGLLEHTEQPDLAAAIPPGSGQGGKSYCCSHTPAITSQQKAASAQPGESLRTGTARVTFTGRAADRPEP